MDSQREIQVAVERYLTCFPGERERLATFCRFVEQYEGTRLFDRRNFEGHITASGIVWNPADGRILLLYHRGLQRWLQPGGHVEASDASIFAAAQREVREETGLRPEDLELFRFRRCCMAGYPGEDFAAGLPIFDLDSHAIPANEVKREDAHIHHDVRFLFALKNSGRRVEINPTESQGVRWLLPEEVPAGTGFDRLLERLPFYGIGA